jgi:hypothetical protein
MVLYSGITFLLECSPGSQKIGKSMAMIFVSLGSDSWHGRYSSVYTALFDSVQPLNYKISEAGFCFHLQVKGGGRQKTREPKK